MFRGNRGMAPTNSSTDGSSSRPSSPFSFGAVSPQFALNTSDLSEDGNRTIAALEPQSIFGSGSSGYVSGTSPSTREKEIYQQLTLDLRRRALSRQQQQAKMAKPDSFKTVMCKGWLETGGCSFGENCRFAHGEEELRPTSVPVDNPKYKTKLCDKYTKTGVCPYGDRCLFIHPKSHGDLASNPYIHPLRLAQLFNERNRTTGSQVNKQNLNGTPLSSRATTKTTWSLSSLRQYRKDAREGKLGEILLITRPSAPLDVDPASESCDSTTKRARPDIQFPNDNEEAGDSDPIVEEKDNIWSEKISQVFDFIIQSDNMARSLAMSEPFLN